MEGDKEKKKVKTHISLCKQDLGVDKQYPNVACRNELVSWVKARKHNTLFFEHNPADPNYH